MLLISTLKYCKHLLLSDPEKKNTLKKHKSERVQNLHITNCAFSFRSFDVANINLDFLQHFKLIQLYHLFLKRLILPF